MTETQEDNRQEENPSTVLGNAGRGYLPTGRTTADLLAAQDISIIKAVHRIPGNHVLELSPRE